MVEEEEEGVFKGGGEGEGKIDDGGSKVITVGKVGGRKGGKGVREERVNGSRGEGDGEGEGRGKGDEVVGEGGVEWRKVGDFKKGESTGIGGSKGGGGRVGFKEMWMEGGEEREVGEVRVAEAGMKGEDRVGGEEEGEGGGIVGSQGYLKSTGNDAGRGRGEEDKPGKVG